MNAEDQRKSDPLHFLVIKSLRSLEVIEATPINPSEISATFPVSGNYVLQDSFFTCNNMSFSDLIIYYVGIIDKAKAFNPRLIYKN